MQRLFIGHSTNVYENGVDAAGRIENEQRLIIKTKGFAPAGLFGNVIFRRASVTVSHESGFRVKITPILDGEIITNCVTFFSEGSSPRGLRETVVLDIPLGLIEPNGNASGARGSNLQIQVETVPAANDAFYGTVHIDNIQILYAGGHATGLSPDGARNVGSV